MMNRIQICLSFLAISLVFSCKEDKDEIPPSVSIDQPTEFVRINVKEGVIVSGKASDNEKVESINIQLVSYSSGRIIPPIKTILPNQKEYSFNLVFEISDSLAETGDYYFQVEADDGENQFSAFRDVKVDGIPKRRLSVIAATSNNSITKFYKMDSLFNSSLFWTIDKEFKDVELNSYDQHLWFIGENSNKVYCFQLKSNLVVLEKSVAVSGINNPFTDLGFANRLLYLGIRNGDLREFKSTLNDRLLYQSPSSKYVDRIVANSDEVVLSLKQNNSSSSSRELITLFKSSGAVKSSVPIAKIPIGLNADGSAQKRLIASDLTSFSQYFYNPDNGSISLIYNNANYSFENAISVNAEEFILYNSSRVIKYNARTDFISTVASNLNDASVAFDGLSRQIWIGSSSEVNVYDYNSQSLIRTINLPSPIKALAIRYNR